MSYAGEYDADEDLNYERSQNKKLKGKNDRLQAENDALRAAIDTTLPSIIDALAVATKGSMQKGRNELSPEEVAYRLGLSAAHMLFKRVEDITGTAPNGPQDFDIPSMVDLMEVNRDLETKFEAKVTGTLGFLLRTLQANARAADDRGKAEEAERWRDVATRAEDFIADRTHADQMRARAKERRDV